MLQNAPADRKASWPRSRSARARRESRRRQMGVQKLRSWRTRDRHEELFRRHNRRASTLALVIALPGRSDLVREQVVRLQLAETRRVPFGVCIRRECGHINRRSRVVVKNRGLWHDRRRRRNTAPTCPSQKLSVVSPPCGTPPRRSVGKLEVHREKGILRLDAADTPIGALGQKNPPGHVLADG